MHLDRVKIIYPCQAQTHRITRWGIKAAAQGDIMHKQFSTPFNLGRRHVIGTGLAATALALGRNASAANKVWLDYDQETLDKVYNQSNYAPNIKIVIGRYGTNSDLTRSRLGQPKRLSYGDTEVEKMDLY